MFEFCSAELKASLELGRDFERKQRESEDNKALNDKETKPGADVEMKDANAEEETKE